jgi:hypothetical protein
MADFTIDQVRQVLSNTFTDQGAASQILNDPAGFFRQNGLDVSEGQDAEFNQYFREIDPALTRRLSAAAEGQLMTASEAESLADLGCTVCKTAVWSIAVGLVALGAAAVAALTPESALVIALARVAGLNASAVAGFLSTLGNVVTQGVNAVASAICRWLGRC